MQFAFMLNRLTKFIAIVVLLGAIGIAAQDEAEEEIEEVVVTGSHIKVHPEDAPLPVTTLARDDLLLEGSPTLLDLIKNLSFSQGNDGETDQFQAGSGADRATINIRGLGPSRSLVLINGNRTTWSPHAIDAQAQLLVDVNILPSVALDRIEILRYGAAATYGSDAIAGVMNYITRSDFLGFEIVANHKMIEDSAGDSEIGAIYGFELGDSTHVVTSYSTVKRSELLLADRDWAILPFSESPRGGWSTVGRPAVFVPLDRFDLTPGGFAGVLIAGVVDPSCDSLGGEWTTSGIAGNTLGGFCQFQYTPFDNLAEEAERFQWFTESTTEFKNDLTLRADLLLTNSLVPAWNTSPSYPPNRLVDRGRTVRANNPGLIDMARQFADDPTYGPIYGRYAACAASYCAYDGGAWDEVAWVYGRFYGQEGPLRDHKRENWLTRLNLSLEGDQEFNWKVSMGFSKSKRESYGGDTMVYRDERGREGLGGHECEALVPNEYNADGQLEFSLETLQQYAGTGPCRYWIPFSNGMRGSHSQVRDGNPNNPTFNPDLDNLPLLDYMLTELGGVGNTSLLTVEGIIQDDIGNRFGGDDIHYAIGGQIRRETYESSVLPGGFNDGHTYPCLAGPEIENCTTNRTGLFGFLPPGFAIDKDRTILALFGEVNIPVSDRLEVQLSSRFENYGGDTGSSLDPKAALKYQLTDAINLHASVGTEFRGPTLNQIVEDNSSNSLQYVGVTGAFKRIDTKGNPDVDPESALTMNLGLTAGYEFFGGEFFLILDYWSFDLKKPLVTEPFNNVLTNACPSGAAAPCDPASPYYDRLVFGGQPIATDVEIININIVNGPDISTDGLDFTATYDLAVAGGQATLGITGTQIWSYDVGSWELGNGFDALGRLNYTTSLARTLVELKHRSFINYARGNINVRAYRNYVGSYDHTGPSNADVTIDEQATYDITVSLDFAGDRYSLWGSVMNLTDEDPPFVSREMNYDAFTHNPFGRIIKFGATYRMN